MANWTDCTMRFFSDDEKVLKKIEKDTDRDFFMTGEEARKYGIVDHVIKSRDDLEKISDKEA